MKDFYYTVDYFQIVKHKRTGKILREGWRGYAGDYASLEEAKEDNPPGPYRFRFIKKYYEVIEEQEAAE